MSEWATIKQVRDGVYRGVLFDTCTLIELFNGQNEDLLARFYDIPASLRFTSIVVRWEFLRNRKGQLVSAEDQTRRSIWLKKSSISVLSLDLRNEEVTKKLRSMTDIRQHLGAITDTLVGTRAVAAAYPVATLNEKDYLTIPGIKILVEFASNPPVAGTHDLRP